jgi:transforming growth factor-beta-induced protein
MKRLFLKMTAAAAVGTMLGACGGIDDGDDVPPGDLLSLATRSGEISAFAAIARVVGLDDELAAPTANLTVLAPTNEAFGSLAARLGFRTTEEMVNALPVSSLEAILRLHLLAGRVTRADLAAGGATQPTLLVQGGTTATLAVNTTRLEFTDQLGRVSIGNVFDIPADNGIFHVVDTVLMPRGLLNVLQTVLIDPERFGTLAGAVTPTFIQTLQGAGPLTLFAPLSSAFTAAQSVINGLSPAQFESVLRHHVLPQQLLSSGIPPGAPVATLSGQTITITAGTPPALASIDDASATNANVTVVDLIATNGVVHAVDKLLLPSFST